MAVGWQGDKFLNLGGNTDGKFALSILCLGLLFCVFRVTAAAMRELVRGHRQMRSNLEENAS